MMEQQNQLIPIFITGPNSAPPLLQHSPVDTGEKFSRMAETRMRDLMYFNTTFTAPANLSFRPPGTNGNC
jgi:hypothetical protein